MPPSNNGSLQDAGSGAPLPASPKPPPLPEPREGPRTPDPAPAPEGAPRHPAGNMTCPRCKNEIPPGAAYCPRCCGPAPGMPPAPDPAPPAANTLPGTFAWLLALLPLAMWMAILLLGSAIVPDDVPDETADAVADALFWAGALISFGVNWFLLRKEGELLGPIRRREEMGSFMRFGIFCPPVYLCARAAKIDKNLGPAITGTILWFFWWMVVLA